MIVPLSEIFGVVKKNPESKVFGLFKTFRNAFLYRRVGRGGCDGCERTPPPPPPRAEKVRLEGAKDERK